MHQHRPFRIKIDAQDMRFSFLHRVHIKYASLIPHESLSLHRISRVSATEDLFDATIVYQNYAKAQARLDQAPTFTMKLHDAVEKTDMPLNILISPSAGSQLHVAVLIHGHICLSFLECLIKAFATALTWLCHRSDRDDKVNVR